VLALFIFSCLNTCFGLPLYWVQIVFSYWIFPVGGTHPLCLSLSYWKNPVLERSTIPLLWHLFRTFWSKNDLFALCKHCRCFDVFFEAGINNAAKCAHLNCRSIYSEAPSTHKGFLPFANVRFHRLMQTVTQTHEKC